MRYLLLTLVTWLTFVNPCYAQHSGGGAHSAFENYLKRVRTNVVPSADITYDLGTSAKRWRNLYVQGINMSNGLTVGTYIDLPEITDPGPPADNWGRFYAMDGGDGLADPYWQDKDANVYNILMSGSGTSQETVEDWVAGLLTEGTYIDLTYDDPAGTLTIAFDATEVTAVTWSDNASASMAWTWDVSGTDVTWTFGNGLVDWGDFDINSADKIEFYDTAIYIDGGADGQLDIEADTTLNMGLTANQVNIGKTGSDVVCGDDFTSDTNNTDDLGLTGTRWKDLYLSGYIDLDEISTPTAPSPEDLRIYSKDVGAVTNFCMEDSASNETCIPANLGGGGTAPVNATYIVQSLDATLTDERVLTEGNYIDLTDGGAGSTMTVAMDPTEVDSVTWGSGADADIVWTFSATTSSGVIAWMEDEDYWQFRDNVDMNDLDITSADKIEFYDSLIYIDGGADGQLDIEADTTLNIATTTTTQINIGSAGADVVFGDDIVSDTTNTDDIGLTGTRWKDLYLSGDAYIGGDDIFATTNTLGALWVGDGTNYNPVVMDGDATIAANGTLTIAADAVVLTTDTSGNYVASVTDGDNGIDGSCASEGCAYAPSFDGTEIDAITWSDNANASNAWTFDVSGTDHTMTAGSGLMTFSHGLTALGDINAGADDDISNIYIHDAGTLVMYDDSDDTSTTWQVPDGTTIAQLTGDLRIYEDAAAYVDLTQADAGYLTINSVSDGSPAIAFADPRVDVADSDTIADSADGNPATATLTPTTSNAQLTCNDADGCTITMGETGVIDGQIVKIVNVSANDCFFADSSGVSELISGTYTMSQYGTLELVYASDRWVEIGRASAAAGSSGFIVVGTYTGDGNATQAVTGVGFQPAVVWAYDQTNNLSAYVKSTSDAGTSAKRWDGNNYDTDNIRSLDADGFTVGDGTDGQTMNANTNTYAYIALK